MGMLAPQESWLNFVARCQISLFDFNIDYHTIFSFKNKKELELVQLIERQKIKKRPRLAKPLLYMAPAVGIEPTTN